MKVQNVLSRVWGLIRICVVVYLIVFVLELRAPQRGIRFLGVCVCVLCLLSCMYDICCFVVVHGSY